MADLPQALRSLRTRYLNKHGGDVAALDRILARAMDVGYHEGALDQYWDKRDNDPCRKPGVSP